MVCLLNRAVAQFITNVHSVNDNKVSTFVHTVTLTFKQLSISPEVVVPRPRARRSQHLVTNSGLAAKRLARRFSHDYRMFQKSLDSDENGVQDGLSGNFFDVRQDHFMFNHNNRLL